MKVLRIYIDLIRLLNKLGLHHEALELGHTILDILGQMKTIEAALAWREYLQLQALVHQNIGLTYELMDRYEEALNAYLAAENYYRTLGPNQRIAHLTNGQDGVPIPPIHPPD